MNPEREAWIALASGDGVGPTTFARLVAIFGSATAVLDAALRDTFAARLREPPAGARAEQDRALPSVLANAVAQAARHADELVAAALRADVQAVTYPDETYPLRLRGLPEAPPVLFVRGSLAALSAPRSVAVVGTRRPTSAGRAFTATLGAGLASCNAAVVSGLAFGIDAAAHASVVEAEGTTVAVIGSGHDALAPAAHRDLASAIVRSGGAIVSEMRSDVRPTKGTYPRRNRLIAGLADATVVVEAPARSGALNTAHWTASYDRELFVVPGRPWERVTAGCLRLLHDVPGCRAVVDVPTLLGDLGYFDEPAGIGGEGPALEAVLVGLSPTESALAREIRAAPTTADRLAERCRLSIQEVAAALTLLELRGYTWSSGPLYFAGGPLRDAR